MSTRTKTEVESVRCAWARGDALVRYHDQEWGNPVHDDRRLFEFLVLEGAQAGLSWETILNKRERYREVFDGFDPERVARFDRRRRERLLRDPGIVRNRLKVESAVTNARAFLAVQEECGSFDEHLWAFVDGEPIVHARRGPRDVPATTPLSETISKEWKRRGFRFVGPTIVYAFLQAVGVVNDHELACWRSPRARRRRA